MHLVAIAEQFERLKNNNAFELLSRFDKHDLKVSVAFTARSLKNQTPLCNRLR